MSEDETKTLIEKWVGRVAVDGAMAGAATNTLTQHVERLEAENKRLREARNLYRDAARRFAEACPLGWAYGARIRAREEASEGLYEVMDSVIRMVHWDRSQTLTDSEEASRE